MARRQRRDDDVRSQVKAFRIGAAGPVALPCQSADDRTLALVRKRGSSWQTVRLAAVPQTMALGWPGLALDAKGLPIVAYSRWNSLNLNTHSSSSLGWTRRAGRARRT